MFCFRFNNYFPTGTTDLFETTLHNLFKTLNKLNQINPILLSNFAYALLSTAHYPACKQALRVDQEACLRTICTSQWQVVGTFGNSEIRNGEEHPQVGRPSPFAKIFIISQSTGNIKTMPLALRTKNSRPTRTNENSFGLSGAKLLPVPKSCRLSFPLEGCHFEP